MAWEQAYGDFENSLKNLGIGVEVYIVFGVQGSGKSTWIRKIKESIQKSTVFFDAALPAIKHRKRVIDIAQKYSTNITAVWINVSLEEAFKRNKKRTKDKIISEKTITSVYYQLNPPTKDEGFTNVIIITDN